MCLFVLSLAAWATAQDTKVQGKGNVEILIKGSPLRGSNGAVWGPDGKIYLASVWSNAAFIVDPETGDMKKIKGSKGTDDLAFHPDGRLFFNWIVEGEVGVLDTDGKVSVVAKVKPGNDSIMDSRFHGNDMVKPLMPAVFLSLLIA